MEHTNNIIYTIVIPIISGIMMIGIFTGFLLSFHWNLKYLKLINKNGLKKEIEDFYWIKVNFSIASLAMVFIYFYLFIKLFLGQPENISLFSNLAIRPVICYLSFTLASAARYNYNSLKEEMCKYAKH